MSILVKKYQLECSKNWKLVALAFLACLVAVMVAILPVQTIQGIGLLHKVSSVYLSWVMISVRVAFVLIFAVVQLCTAEYVV